MEPIPIKRGSSHSELVPVEGSEFLPEAHQRAPTLVGSPEAGGGGKVQLWAPDAALVRKQAYRAGAAVAVYFAGSLILIRLLLLFTSGSISPLLFTIFLCLFLLPWLWIGMFGMGTGAAIPAMRRKRYLTTDDAGIGITTWKASRYLAWEDVVMVQPLAPWGLRLQSHSGEKVEMNLSGYPTAVRRELLDRIVQKADLVHLKGWYFLQGEKFYVRPGYQFSPATGKLLPPSSQLAIPTTVPAIQAPAEED